MVASVRTSTLFRIKAPFCLKYIEVIVTLL